MSYTDILTSMPPTWNTRISHRLVAGQRDPMHRSPKTMIIIDGIMLSAILSVRDLVIVMVLTYAFWKLMPSETGTGGIRIERKQDMDGN
jgi:hypothetical protein